MNSKDYKTLHEAGILTDIIGFMADSDISFISDIGQKILSSKKDPMQFSVGSNIAKAASGLTAVFPVIVTEATPLDQGVMVSKSIERKAVALLQMLFAANQITSATGAHQYLKNFHSNISSSLDLSGMDVDDVIEYTNKLSESVAPGDITYKVSVNEAIKAVIEDTKNNTTHVLEENINESSLNDYRVRQVFNELQAWKSSKTTTSIESKPRYTDFLGNSTSTVSTEIQDAPSAVDMKNAYEVLNKSVLRTDIQKANESVPSLIIINFVSIIEGGDKVVNTCVIGVKAVLHYVSSEEMINRIVLKNADRRGLFNFLRATTREISFFRDFLFAVDRAKIDAVAKSGKGSSSKIWKLLELRANRAKLNNASGRTGSDTAAITSLIISKAEADLIKKAHRIDITKPGTLLAIMRGYNFMCAAIVDEVSERVDFLYDDGSKNFETLSFMSLEREDGNGMYKKVINLMAKGR